MFSPSHDTEVSVKKINQRQWRLIDRKLDVRSCGVVLKSDSLLICVPPTTGEFNPNLSSPLFSIAPPTETPYKRRIQVDHVCKSNQKLFIDWPKSDNQPVCCNTTNKHGRNPPPLPPPPPVSEPQVLETALCTSVVRAHSCYLTWLQRRCGISVSPLQSSTSVVPPEASRRRSAAGSYQKFQHGRVSYKQE